MSAPVTVSVPNNIAEAEGLSFCYAVKMSVCVTLACGPWHKDLKRSLVENIIEVLNSDLDNDTVIDAVQLIDVSDEGV